MKKFIFLLPVLLMAVFVNVQAQENLKWGVMAGMNVSKLSSTGFDSKIGYHVGVKAELGLPQLANGVFVDAAALISAKGSKTDMGDLGSQKINATYLDIPIHIGYKYAVNEKFNIFGSFGPYAAIGLFGKTKVEELDYSDEGDLINVSEKYNTFGNDGFKRFDFGLGFRIGAELNNKYQISLSYDFGLLKTYESKFEIDDEDYQEIDLGSGAKNRNLTISIAYLF